MPYAQLLKAGIGAVSSIGGSRGESQARGAATAAAQGGVDAANATRQFFGKAYNKNRSMYGRIERDRIRAAEKLNADGLEAQGLQNVRRSFQAAQKRRIARSHAKGVADSGLDTQQAFELDIQQAEAEAKVRFDAPLQALQIQTQALQPGLQREQQLASGISASTGQQVTAANNLATLQAGFAESSAERTGLGIGSLLDLTEPGSGKGGKGTGVGDIASFISSLGGA